MLRFVILGLFSILAKAELVTQNSELDFIRTQNLSYLIGGDSIDERTPDYEWEVWPRPEPIGYIGDNYRRLRFRWLSVEKTVDNPLVYNVTGKTKVGNNICTFHGHLRITTAMQSASEEYPDERIGTVFGTFHLIEDPEERGTGEFEGRFWSNYWLPHGLDGPPLAAAGPSRSLDHDNEILVYNSLETYDPGYGNNQFTGTWTSYRSGSEKVVAWADYRFSFPTDLDVGASEFSPGREFLSEGWQTYFNAWIHADSEAEQEAALAEERRKWWE